MDFGKLVKSIINQLMWLGFLYNLFKHPKQTFLMVGGILFGLLGIIAAFQIVGPLALGAFNTVEGNSTNNLPVIEYQPLSDIIVVRNDTGKHLSDIQYKIPVYQCPESLPLRVYDMGTISDSCVPVRGIFGIKVSVTYQVSSNTLTDVAPGETVYLNHIGDSVGSYMESVVGMAEPGYHLVVPNVPVFVGAVNK